MAVVVTRDLMRRVAARTGYPYYEAWSSHNKGVMKDLLGAVVHHTGSAWNPKVDYCTLAIVRDGRAGLENSLSMFGLGLSGATYLISPYVSWHAGDWSLGGNLDGNGKLAGIEAESDGRSWTDEQRDAYPRLVASILLETKYKDRRYTGRHADGAMPRGRKTDASGLDMGKFWDLVDFYLAHPEYIHKDYRPLEGPVKNLILGRAKDGKVYVGDGLSRRHVADETELSGLQYWIGQKGGDGKVYDFADLRVLGRDIGLVAQETSVGWVRTQILRSLGVSKDNVEQAEPSSEVLAIAQRSEAALARIEAASATKKPTVG